MMVSIVMRVCVCVCVCVCVYSAGEHRRSEHEVLGAEPS